MFLCACADDKQTCEQRVEVEFGDMEYPPNNTIYINNLNEKVKKDGK